MSKQKTSIQFLKKIKSKIIIFHYASSSIDDDLPKISSISVYDTSDNNISQFSRRDASEDSERLLLENFFKYLGDKYKKGFYIMGWNIKKPHYGLEILKKRYWKLNPKALIKIDQKKEYDLDELIKRKYFNYFGGLHIIANANDIRLNNFVLGKKEIDLFNNNEFKKLDLSTYSKVTIIYKLFQLFISDKLNVSYNDDISYSLDGSGYDYYTSFNENLKKIKELIDFKNKKITNSTRQEFLRNLLYINVITTMEAYLGDAFRINVFRKDKYLIQFTKSYKNFEDTKYVLPDLSAIVDYDKTTLKQFVRDECTKEMNKIVFHKLNLVTKLYKDVFNIDFPKDLTYLYKAVKKRHDLVHRNGKDENGVPVEIKFEDLEELFNQVQKLVNYLESKISSL
jgi:hypothetical protein